ncbi:hypothetical protein JCM33374_g2938 [Metschnikowia sp. JCM 33374]|nr:hypothetical protein JCM33374_g2938 [Metschnikowia sp. JCM 33374]
MSDSTDLAQKVQQLSDLVHKQGQVIAQTGKQLMELQVENVKSRMANLDAKPASFNPEDFASNEDIVQLVCELQGQLDFIEERSMARTFNSHLTSSSKETDNIAPLCNRDGTPAPEFFPKTVGQLNAIAAADLLRLCEFYDLIVENETNPEIDAIVQSDNLTPEDAEKLSSSLSNGLSSSKTIEQKLDSFSATDLHDLFDELARFIGVRIRRGSQW